MLVNSSGGKQKENKNFQKKLALMHIVLFILNFIGIILKIITGRKTMNKSLIILVCIALITLGLSGCASKESADESSQAGKASHTVSVPTGEFHEFCDMWDVGDTINVSFTSTKPVAFNVHYHTAYSKHYPIKEVVVDNFSGSFVVDSKDTHCGMWTNNNDSFVKVTYEMEVTPK
jgi:hypothetical protein